MADLAGRRTASRHVSTSRTPPRRGGRPGRDAPRNRKRGGLGRDVGRAPGQTSAAGLAALESFGSCRGQEGAGGPPSISGRETGVPLNLRKREVLRAQVASPAWARIGRGAERLFLCKPAGPRPGRSPPQGAGGTGFPPGRGRRGGGRRFYRGADRQEPSPARCRRAGRLARGGGPGRRFQAGVAGRGRSAIQYRGAGRSGSVPTGPFSAFQMFETLKNILGGLRTCRGWRHNSQTTHHLIEAITLGSAKRLAFDLFGDHRRFGGPGVPSGYAASAAGSNRTPESAGGEERAERHNTREAGWRHDRRGHPAQFVQPNARRTQTSRAADAEGNRWSRSPRR